MMGPARGCFIDIEELSSFIKANYLNGCMNREDKPSEHIR
jgi:hypothetical protein